jgi:hypothetical protein
MKSVIESDRNPADGHRTEAVKESAGKSAAGVQNSKRISF